MDKDRVLRHYEAQTRLAAEEREKVVGKALERFLNPYTAPQRAYGVVEWPDTSTRSETLKNT